MVKELCLIGKDVSEWNACRRVSGFHGEGTLAEEKSLQSLPGQSRNYRMIRANSFLQFILEYQYQLMNQISVYWTCSCIISLRI